MPRNLQELNAIFKRGFAVSLAAVGVLLFAEIARILASGALARLDATEVARFAIYLVGTWVFFAAALGVLENVVVALGARLIRLPRGHWTGEPIALATVLFLLSPLARVTFALVENELLAWCLIGVPFVAGLVALALRKPWRRDHPRRGGFSPALLVAALPFTALVFWLLDRHLVVERLSSPRYFSLSIAYFAGLMICEVGLTFLLFLCLHWKTEGRLTNAGPRTRRLLPLWLAGLVAVGVATSLFDVWFLANLYPEFHAFLKIGLYIVAECAVILAVEHLRDSPHLRGLLRPLGARSRLLGAGLGVVTAACVVYTAAWCDPTSPAWSVAVSKTYATPSIIDLERTLFDTDRDGFSVAFGGHDCDNLDADVNPGAAEIPENGVDDNCFAGDLTAEKIARAARDRRARRQQISDWWSRHPSNPHRRFNVVLVTIDSLRADHTGFMGYPRRTTPYLDGLAAKSIVFTNAYCQGGWTSISVPSIIKGVNPSRVLFSRVYEDRYARLWFPNELPEGEIILQMFTVPALDRNRSIAEIVDRDGYQTIAVLNDDFTDYFQRRFGYTSGFDVYYTNNSAESIRDVQLKRQPVTARHVTEQAIRELSRIKGSEPFFMWIHHFDPHGPHGDTKENVWGDTSIDRYDGEIAFTDRYLGELLMALELRGLMKNTIIVVTGDHGEAFGEHGNTFHGTGVYQEEIKIPLVVYVPGIAHRVVDANAAHVDIVPTILDLVGIRTDISFDGESLVHSMIGDPGIDDRPIYSMTWRYNLAGRRVIDQRALIVGKSKLIYDKLNPRYELYDIGADPAETNNLTASAPALFARIRELMLTKLETDDLHTAVEPAPR